MPTRPNPNKVLEEIELDGTVLTLAVDLNFFRTFNRLTGIDLLAGDEFKPGADEIVAMLYASAKSGKTPAVVDLGPEDGMDYIGSIAHPANLQYALEKVRTLMAANEPAKESRDPLAAPKPSGEAVPTG